MGVGGAERLPSDWDEGYEAHETYARSLTTIRMAGAVALKGELAPNHNAYEALYKDWESGLAEMIKISPELGNNLEISRVDSFELRDGVMVDNNGRPMTQIIGGAKRKSAAMAKKDSRIVTQYNRDCADEYNMLRVDGMTQQQQPQYNTIVVLSMHPVEAMGRDGAAFWENPGKGFFYVEGMDFLQLYHTPSVTDEQGQPAPAQQLVTGTFSIDHGDKATWLEVLEEFGLHIPATENTDNFVRHGLKRNLTTEQALDLPQAIRQRYYEKRQIEKERLSVNEFMDKHQPVIQRHFKQLYIPMAQAAYSGLKNETVHHFVSELFKRPEVFKPEVLQGMMRIMNRQRFDADDARLVEGLIRYGVVEGLRNNVKAFSRGDVQVAPSASLAPEAPYAFFDFRDIVDRIYEGVEARRVYIACGDMSDFSVSKADRDGSLVRARNGNEIVGGNLEASEEVSIPDTIRCIKCAQFSRKEDVIGKDQWCCPKCEYAIDICTGKELKPSNMNNVQKKSVIPIAQILFKKKKMVKTYAARPVLAFVA